MGVDPQNLDRFFVVTSHSQVGKWRFNKAIVAIPQEGTI
jgi:hypothetical protein